VPTPCARASAAFVEAEDELSSFVSPAGLAETTDRVDARLVLGAATGAARFSEA